MAILSSDLIRQGAAGASTGYTIDQSIRFNPGDTPSMTKTYSSAGDRTSWTWSCWFKLGSLNGFTPASNLYYTFFSVDEATNDANRGTLQIIADSGVASAIQFQFLGHSTVFLKTNRQFRDPSAWYHLVLVWDSDNAIAGERARLYINGERETSLATENNPSSGQEIGINLGAAHRIGAAKNISNSNIIYHWDGYMADIHFLDGYSYGPEYFGEFDSNGIWIPKEYDGSYGSNGFKIDGRDSSDLGDDESGQGNDYTTSGLAANDQVEDTPTNNKITFNPLNNQRSGGTPSNGNLDYVGPGTRTMIGTTGGPFPTSGKWAVAIKAAQVSTDVGWSYGLQKADDSDMGDAAGSNEDIGAGTGGANMTPQSSDGYYYNYSTSTATDPSLPITTSDEFWLAVDIDSGKYWFGIYDASASGYKWVAADAGLDGDPGAGSNETGSLTGLQNNTGNFEFIFSSKQTSQFLYLQREADLAGAVPTGYTYWENVKDLI